MKNNNKTAKHTKLLSQVLVTMVLFGYVVTH